MIWLVLAIAIGITFVALYARARAQMRKAKYPLPFLSGDAGRGFVIVRNEDG